ncbi:ATP-binding cassette domain-containing protein [Niallia sp. NCCP-28]|uniref:ATP-binding cassette domain-containing protein n=1 Tax=Niallia sp. NCCP-28 TaxID=2934712 RepID=UPI002082AC5A|nr:ATP-binding cassette domain-containing protein [Niallia sp. NCCP-28]GKU80672.1 hypothetical protein NCCP28_00680 [Niallia sp. NCCP-28]
MKLECCNISFQYENNNIILDNVNLSMESGEVVGLLGPSGYAKSTLGKILAGHIKPHQGKVILDENPIKKTGFQPVQMIYQHPEQAVNPKWRMEKLMRS